MEINDTIAKRMSGEMGTLVLEYAPLVKAVAWRYQGRGAEFEDLVQEGFVALLLLIPKCQDKEWLAYFLKRRLPGYVRAAAARLRGQAGRGEFVFLEEIEEIISENDTPKRMDEAELSDLLKRTLTKEETNIVQSLTGGFTQKELACSLGITQQAVSAKVRRIRYKLKAFMQDTEEGANKKLPIISL